MNILDRLDDNSGNPRNEAMRLYAHRRDDLTDWAEILVATGSFDKARDVFFWARVIERAYEAELVDPA